MEKKDIKDILLRVSEGTASEADESTAKFWLHYLHRKDLAPLSEVELQQESEIIYKSILKENPGQQKVVRLWPRIAALAAAVAVVVSGIYFFNHQQPVTETGAVVAQVNDIDPGKIGATLTLADGKKIRLSDAANGELVKEAGIAIRKTADGEVIYEIKAASGANAVVSTAVNTLSTARGETYMVVLPDQSKVWLNAASSLTYAVALNRQKARKVRLQGEAYFEVSKDQRHPFVVETGLQEVTVLGTHFNINSYSDESATTTTLLEGSVRVNPVGQFSSGKAVVLEPDQQAQLNTGGKLSVREISADGAIAWKDGKFTFKNETLSSIMRKVARWYDVEVEFKNERNSQVTFSGKVSRFDKVSKVLGILEQTGDAKFRITGKKITVL